MVIMHYEYVGAQKGAVHVHHPAELSCVLGYLWEEDIVFN